MENKFDLQTIEATFTRYKKGEMFDGVVIIKREDGAVFNIGGKNDAFLPKSEVDDYDNLKIGDRFKVVITSYKNEDGEIEVSKKLADNQIISTQNANKLKLGSAFTFVAQKGTNEGLYSKMGEFEIFVPNDEISHAIKDVRKSEGKQFEAIVTAIDKDQKSIIASIKLLEDQTKQNQEDLFWKSIFINKIVEGKVKKILPYGAFVDVGGVDCFCHISNFSYKRINSPDEVVKLNEKYSFKVVKVDRENKKVELSKKALDPSPKRQAIENLEVGQTYEGTVVKILAFGAIVSLDNGASGLVHIKNATERNDKNIYEIVKLDSKVKVEVVDIDLDEEKVSFKLI